MFCIYCGAENPDDSIFCRNCGKQQNKTVGLQTLDSPRSSLPQTSQGSERPLNEQTPREQTSWHTNPISGEKSSSSMQQHIGSLIAACGGLLALATFFLFPYLSLGFLGSLTGSQLASTNSQFIQGTGILWLEPIVAVAIIGIAMYLIVRSLKYEIDKKTAKRLAATLIFLGGITLLVLLIKYALDTQPSTSGFNLGYSGPSLASFYGAGMWIYFLAMLAACVGGIIQFSWFSSKK